jgi:hypothetical protein
MSLNSLPGVPDYGVSRDDFCVSRDDFSVSHETNSLSVCLKKFSLKKFKLRNKR